jgi:hypothetical protein
MTQEALLKEAQTRNQKAQAQLTYGKEFEQNANNANAITMSNTNLQARQANVRLLEAQSFGRELENSKFDQSMQDQLMKVHYEALLAEANLKGQQKLNKLRELEINLNKLGIQKGDEWYFRVMAQLAGGATKIKFNNLKHR